MSKVGTPKIDNDSGAAGRMTALQHNAFLQQVEGVITDANGTLIESDSMQFRQAINSYASIANFYIDSGTATEYVLNPQGGFKAPIDALTTWNGMLIRFRPTNNNTGVATLRLAGLNGGLPFNTLREDGTVIQAGDFSTTRDAILRYDLTASAFRLLTVPTPNASETVAGISYLAKTIVLSNNISNPNTQIDYSSGTFNFSDGSNSAILNSGTINFATTGINGLDTGSIAGNTTYHCFAIYNPTTKVSAGLASTSATTPTLPSGYTKLKRIGSLLTNVSSQIIQGTWYADNKFELATPILSISGASQVGSTETLRTITAPVGIKTEVFGSFQATISGSGSAANFKIYSGNITLPTLSAGDGQCYASAGVCNGQSPFSVKTNTSRQVKTNRFNIQNNNAATISIAVDGWIDYTLNY